MELISIVIPVYRAEQYLRSCVASVQKQNYDELEIILVEDGSPDRCSEICDQLAAEDPRIKAIHKKNGGASSARNAGLAAAKGGYICFVDSDDLLPPTAIEDLVTAMEGSNGDYAAGICGIKGSQRVKNRIDEERVVDFNTQPKELLSYITGSGSYSPYAKLYRNDLIQKHRISFSEDLKCSEDALFIRQYLQYCNKVVLVPKVVYSYNTVNENSLSKKGYPEYSAYFIEKLKALKKLVQKLPIGEKERSQFLSCRAIHGLRISISHYIKNFASEEEQLRFIGRSIELFLPWIQGGENGFLKQDAELGKWWSRNESLVRQKNVEQLVKEEKKNQSKHQFRNKLKSLVKKCLHR